MSHFPYLLSGTVILQMVFPVLPFLSGEEGRQVVCFQGGSIPGPERSLETWVRSSVYVVLLGPIFQKLSSALDAEGGKGFVLYFEISVSWYTRCVQGLSPEGRAQSMAQSFMSGS